MDQRFDLNGDEGILKTIRAHGQGRAPRAHEFVTCAYRGSLEDGTVFDTSEGWRFELGTGKVIRGFELGVASMLAGETAHFDIRFDYGAPQQRVLLFTYITKRHTLSHLGYGEAGLLGKVPPYATLHFDITVLAIEQRTAEEVPALALPSSNDDGAREGETSVTTVVVDGEPVKLDKLGPVVINKDGTASRITNWEEMTPAEQQKTLRIISKRNMARIAASRQHHIDQTIDQTNEL